MLIFIRALAGTVIRLNVSPCETVETVKTRISQQKGIPVSHLHLIFDGVELSNTTPLAAAKISHGALLRLVLGVQSGPLNRETAHLFGSNQQSCHRLSSSARPPAIAVPVAPMHQIPATTTMVFPVLCTPTRVPSGHQEQPPGHQQYHHPQLQYVTNPTAASCTTIQPPAYPSKTGWDETVSYGTPEFSMDEETFGLGDDSASELADYLSYAIDEDELQQASTYSESRSTLDSCEDADQEVDERSSLSPPSSSFVSQSSSPSCSSSSSSSGCRLIPVYPIPSQMHFIVNPTDIPQLNHVAFPFPQPTTHRGALMDNPPRPVSAPLARFAPIPVAYGIPVPMPLAPPIASQHPRKLLSYPPDTDKDRTRANASNRDPPSVTPPMAFALPAHLTSAHFLPTVDWPGVIPSVPGSDSATPTHVPGLIIPPFALLPVGTLNARPGSSRSARDFPTPPISTGVPALPSTDRPRDLPSAPTDCCSPLRPPSSSTRAPVHTTPHSSRPHIPGTKEPFTVESSSVAPCAVPSLRPSTTTTTLSQTRCFSCQKRTRPAQGFSCRCQRWFCQKHHHPEDHDCAFDFKTMRLLSTPCTPVLSCSPNTTTGLDQPASDPGRT